MYISIYYSLILNYGTYMIQRNVGIHTIHIKPVIFLLVIAPDTNVPNV